MFGVDTTYQNAAYQQTVTTLSRLSHAEQDKKLQRLEKASELFIAKVNAARAAEGKPPIPGIPERFIAVTPHPKQKLFLELDDTKEALFGGATGGGKTVALLADALRFIHVKDYSALLLRRNFPDLKQEGGLIEVAHDWLTPTSAKWNEQDKEWLFPSGAKLRFGYLDTENDKYRYQGGEYQYIGFDEVTQFSESQYLYLYSRLRKKQGLNVPLRMRAATNPGGIGGQWVYDRFIPENFSPTEASQLRVWIKEGLDQHGRPITRAFVPSLLDDNPSLDRESYIESLMQLDEITREQYLKGDWLIQIRGDILYTYSEAHTVISWDQFASVFGEKKIPAHWRIGVYQDFGTTSEHPCVTSWFATAGANAPEIGGVSMKNKVFLYRGMMLTQCTASEVAKLIHGVMSEHGEIGRCHRWQMSHEASSERLEYIQQQLPFSNWPTGKTRGIEQLKGAFMLSDTDKPHPFKPQLMGCPQLFLIVDHNELVYPKTDAGLVRHRAEIPAYHTHKLKTGEVMTRWEPYPLFNDAIDTMRAAASDYFPTATPLTFHEELNKKVQEHTVFATELKEDTSIAAQISRSMATAKALKELQEDGWDVDDQGIETEREFFTELTGGW